MRLKAKDRKRLNKALYELGRTYHDEIPLGTIRAVLKLGARMDILQEDYTPWSGFLCGDSGYATFNLGYFPGLGQEMQVIGNSSLVLSWHQMQSGRHEVVAYLS
jgi:hypothetical protein